MNGERHNHLHTLRENKLVKFIYLLLYLLGLVRDNDDELKILL